MLTHALKEGEPDKIENSISLRGVNKIVTGARPTFPFPSTNVAKNCDEIAKSSKRKIDLIYDETSKNDSPSKRTDIKTTCSNQQISPNYAINPRNTGVTSRVNDTGQGLLTKSPSNLGSSAVEKVQEK